MCFPYVRRTVSCNSLLVCTVRRLVYVYGQMSAPEAKGGAAPLLTAVQELPRRSGWAEPSLPASLQPALVDLLQMSV